MKTRRILFSVLIVLFFWGTGSAETQPTLPRTIITFYDSKENPDIRTTRTHRYLEMTMNHLGLKLKYFDINKPLPLIQDLEDVRGVFTWFNTDQMPDPTGFLGWADQLMERKINWVIFGLLGVVSDIQGKKTPLPFINRYLGRLGLQTQENWKNVTYDVKLNFTDKKMVAFERPYTGILPPFMQVYRLDKSVTAHLSASWGKDLATTGDLIVTGPHGGYAAPDYYISGDEEFYFPF